jgi:phosphate transport system permease protein
MTTGAYRGALGQTAPVLTDDRPKRRPVSARRVGELLGPLASAFALVWLVFHLAGLNAPFGFFVCWMLAFLIIFTALAWRSHGPLGVKDRLATVAVTIGAMAAMLPVALIFWLTAYKGAWVVFDDFPHWLVADYSRANPGSPVTSGGVGHSIVGTVEQAGLAAAMAVPVALLTALFLVGFTGRLASFVRALIDAMSSIPTIVAGLFIYLVWVVPHSAHLRQGGSSGYSGLAGSFALALLMAPVVTRGAEEVLQVVPGSLREASLALGASEWRTTLRVIVPTARAGLISAMLIGIARAIGETAPVLLTVDGSVRYNLNPFNGPQSDLVLQTYLLRGESGANAAPEQWATAVVLITFVLVIFTLARLAGSGAVGLVSRRVRARLQRATVQQ